MRDRGAPASRVRVIYFNAWPEVGRGYNHLSTLGEKLRVFRQALAGMLEFHPDAVVIGCNTLSILREVAGVETTVPLVGIVDAAETMLYHYLSGDEERRLVVFGTETTVGSGLYRERLRRRGIDPRRMEFAPADSVQRTTTGEDGKNPYQIYEVTLTLDQLSAGKRMSCRS